MSEWFFRGDYNIIQNNKSSIHNSLKNIRDDIYVGLHKNDQDIQEEFSLLLDVNNLKFISLDDLLGSIVLLEKISPVFQRCSCDDGGGREKGEGFCCFKRISSIQTVRFKKVFEIMPAAIAYQTI